VVRGCLWAQVIFLHAARAVGALSCECTALLDQLADEMRAHDPRAACKHAEVADEASLAVRCVELHTYQVCACLMERDHKDSGSTLSMSVVLSDPSQLEGGKFLTWAGKERDTPVVHECGRGDGVLFRSEDYHNVSKVTKGTRQTLVMELWAGAKNKVDRNA
jgi:hypothetical protein